MEFLDHFLRQLLVSLGQHIVKTRKMVHCFNNIVNIGRFIRLDIDGVGLVNVAGLFLGQATSFNPVGIKSELDLGLMVQTAFERQRFFFL